MSNNSVNNGNGATADGAKGKKPYDQKVREAGEVFNKTHGRMSARAGRDQRYAEALATLLREAQEDFDDILESFSVRERVDKPHFVMIWELVNQLNEAELPLLKADLNSFRMTEVEELGLTEELNDVRKAVADGELPIGKKVLAAVGFRRMFSERKSEAFKKGRDDIVANLRNGGKNTTFRPGATGAWRQGKKQPEGVVIVGQAPASADALAAQEAALASLDPDSTAPAGPSVADPAHPLIAPAPTMVVATKTKKKQPKHGGRPRHGEDVDGFEGSLTKNRQRQGRRGQ